MKSVILGIYCTAAAYSTLTASVSFTGFLVEHNIFCSATDHAGIKRMILWFTFFMHKLPTIMTNELLCRR